MGHSNIIHLNKLKSGIDQVASATNITLGPKGRNVMLGNNYGSPLVTNDSASILDEIFLDNPYENMGAQLVKVVAQKTNEVVGDGTTTAIILMQAIIENGVKSLIAGANPVLLRHGIEVAVTKVIQEMENIAKPLQTEKEKYDIISASVENEELSRLLSESLEQVNDRNSIVVENSQTMESFLEKRPGFSFERGFISPNMINQHELSRCVYNDVDVLIIDKIFKTANDILPVLELALNRKTPLLLIAENLEGEALQAINLNNINGTVSIVVVQAPTHGTNRVNELLDIEALVGAQAITNNIISIANNIDKEILGYAQQIIVEKDKTTIIGGNTNRDKVNNRISLIRNEMETQEAEIIMEILTKRLTRLAGGTIVLKVGACTETDYKEKQLRINNALCAIQAAMEGGIVAGGGTTYLKLSTTLQSLNEKDADVQTGINIVKEALKAPIKQIVINSGKEPFSIIEKVQELPEGYGYNALTGKCENLFETGIIEPAKVVKTALQNAASVAVMVLTVGAIVKS